MKRLALIFVLAASPAAADQCDVAARRLAAEAQISVQGRTGDVIRLRHRSATELTLACAGGSVIRVRGVLQEGSARDFVRLMGRVVGAAYRVPADLASGDLGACAQAAAARPNYPRSEFAGSGKLSCFVLGESIVFEVERQ